MAGSDQACHPGAFAPASPGSGSLNAAPDSVVICEVSTEASPFLQPPPGPPALRLGTETPYIGTFQRT